MTDLKIKLTDLAQERVVLFDGAMGTQIQARDPGADDFGGSSFEGCNELLCVTRPDWIKTIHDDYFRAGADAVETNTFGSTPLVLAEYDIADRAYELTLAAAKIACEVRDSYTSEPKYVIGAVGPGTKLVTLGHVDYATMLKSYTTQMDGLIDGGVDAILLETAQDIKQLKISIRAARDSMQRKKIEIPILVQVTVELTGTMLVGSDIQTALSVLEMFPINGIGLNCATGPDEMRPHLEFLSQSAPFLISCLPNAGLPENVKGKTVYPLGPELFAQKVSAIVKKYGVNIAGGCCGTTPEHIRQLSLALGDRKLGKREPRYENSVTSLYNAVPMELNPKPLYVGERTNANGSKLFRDLLKVEDYDGLVAIAKGQLKEGSHVLDCCTAYVGRDEKRDMREFLNRVITQVNIPIMIDSTEVDVIEESLKIVPGKSIVNSINLEDGEEKARQILQLCKTHGASVVALTIDEDGMAKTAAKKLEIAKRIYKIAHEDFGLKPEDIIFDTLTFTLGSGDEEFRRSAIETLEAIRLVKTEMPGVKTILGLSNVSFGLDPHTRKILNSVMLSHAVSYGLDMAIANAGKIVPLFKLTPEEKQVFEDLLYDRRAENYDPLKVILEKYSGAQAKKNASKSEEEKSKLSLPERLANHIVDGEKVEIIPTLKEALKDHKPLDIINNFLLAGMKIVGDRFGAGEMQLPFVLESAEAMKAAVAFLEPFMDKNDAGNKKGKILLATVKGDVHDIGKNLVDIILSNNGFDVINIGIKQPIEAILEKYYQVQPDAIGLSGLLVKSTVIMKSDLEQMHAKNLEVPVILGGAALTRKFVEEDCQAVYRGKVYYAEDAFEGLRLMGQITGKGASAPAPAVEAQKTKPNEGDKKLDASRPKIRAVRRTSEDMVLNSDGQSPWVKRVESIPTPPFWGSKSLELNPSELYKYLDEFALVRNRWSFAQGEMSDAEFQKVLEEKARPLLNTWKARSERENLLIPKAVYGYFSCQSQGNSLVVYESATSNKELVRFDFPRQENGRRLCIADFYMPVSSGKRDVLAMQLVTMADRASEFAQQLYQENRYSDYFYFHGFGTEMAEAFAEFLHAKIRKELGIHKNDARNMRQLFGQGYQGSRYSFGYPACPDLEDNRVLFKCLTPELIGVSLTESGQMVPEQSTCAIVAWHPQARYFAI